MRERGRSLSEMASALQSWGLTGSSGKSISPEHLSVRPCFQSPAQMYVKHLAKCANSVSLSALSFPFLATLQRALTHFCTPHCLDKAARPHTFTATVFKESFRVSAANSHFKRGSEPIPSSVTEGWSWNRGVGGLTSSPTERPGNLCY